MAIQNVVNEYQIPRGRVFFDQHDANGATTGEVPFGNCPDFNITIESEKSDHYSSESGLRQKDASVTVEVNRTATITCDNISAANLARYLAGTVETVTQASGSVTDETITAFKGRQYQLGKTEANPAGVRNITDVVVTNSAGTVTHVLNTDYAVDLELGRLQILAGGAIADAASIKVDYTRPAKTWTRIKTGSNTELAGAIRVISDNASGEKRDFYMPKVNLTPNGELPVITTDTNYVSMEFTVEILKPSNADAIYVDGRPLVA
jgi:hypothetical protein